MDFEVEETKDTHEDTRYLVRPVTRSLNHSLNSTVNQDQDSTRKRIFQPAARLDLKAPQIGTGLGALMRMMKLRMRQEFSQ